VSALPPLLLVGASPEREAGVRAHLQHLAEVRVEREAAQAVGAAVQCGARIALVDLATDADAALEVIEELVRRLPDVAVVALADAKDPDLILRAMRAGAREFVGLHEAGGLGRVVRERGHGARAADSRGKLVSLFPAKGGVGATTLAVNLSGMLVQAGRRVLLVDLDPHQGDVPVFLDTPSRCSLADVLRNRRRLDREMLSAALSVHGSGVFFLSHSEQIGDAERISPADLTLALGFLAQHFDFVLCDGVRGFDDWSLAAVDASDRVLLVLTQDVPAVRNARRCLELFGQLGCEGKVKVVVNRHRKNAPLEVRDIAESVGAAIASRVSNDYQTVASAVDRGVMLKDAAPRARVTEDLRLMAELLCGADASPKPGFLRNLFAGRLTRPRPNALTLGTP